MKESDWKKFKKIKERALDRFCVHALADFEEAIQKEGRSNHERYLCLYKLVDNADERLGILFDQHSRSKAPLQLKLIRREGLVKDRELEGISDELLKFTEPRYPKCLTIPFALRQNAACLIGVIMGQC